MPPSSSSLSTDSRVGAYRRRIHEDEDADSSFSHLPKEGSVVGTEDVDVTPDPVGLTNSAQLPTTIGLGKRRRRIVSDDEEEERPAPYSTKVLRNRNVPLVVASEPLEEVSSSDDEPIRYFLLVFHSIMCFIIIFCIYTSQRTRISVAKANRHTSPGTGSIGSANPAPRIQGRGKRSSRFPIKKKFECNFCTKKFSQISGLNAHVRTHTGERPFKCHVCDKRFTQHSILNTHYMVHTGEKPHQCGICKKRFSLLGNLNVHLRSKKHQLLQNGVREHQERIHINEKTFQCDMCEKEFNRMYDLKIHKRLHTNERPYKCGGCQKTYVCANRLHTHWKKSNCEPNSTEESSPTDSNGSDVEGNYNYSILSKKRVIFVTHPVEINNCFETERDLFG